VDKIWLCAVVMADRQAGCRNLNKRKNFYDAILRTKGKSTHQQSHKENMCKATAPYQHKKDPAPITMEET
jgi:hypothetical protein